MENLKALAKVGADIKRLATNIIVRSLPLMKGIDSEDSEYVKTLVEEIPDLQPSQALAILQEISLEWVIDAERAKEEIDSFVVYDDTSIVVNSDGCPILGEIWRGDAYDKAGIEGLKIFRDDLRATYEGINEETLMKTARERLLGED